MNVTSVKVRFLTTLTTNVLRTFLAFIAGLVIARHLGPETYGDFIFLLGSFTALSSLVDMASSSAFYTFISRNGRGRYFYLVYSCWVAIQFFIIMLLIFIMPGFLKEKIWLGHSSSHILLAFLASFSMFQIWNFAGQIGESIRDTVGVQVRNLLIAFTHLSCILVLGFMGLLSMKKLFMLNSVLYSSFALLYCIRIVKTGTFSNPLNENLSDIIKEFTKYCYPLAFYTIIGFIYSFLDYWLLQKFGGSAQQGYYAVGLRISSIALIATASILQVFWKEISEAHFKNDLERIKYLYSNTYKRLYFFGGMVSCLLIPFSRELLTYILGPAFSAAWIPLTLMLLYPLHQSLGQITSSMLLGMGYTKAQSIIGLVFMGYSIPLTYLFLAPSDSIIPGLNMGATGLAIKMVFCNFLAVNIMAFYVSKYIGYSHDWFHQFYVLILLLPFGFISKKMALFFLSIITSQPSIIGSVLCALLLYVPAALAAVYFFPSLISLDQSEIHSMINKYLRRGGAH